MLCYRKKSHSHQTTSSANGQAALAEGGLLYPARRDSLAILRSVVAVCQWPLALLGAPHP